MTGALRPDYFVCVNFVLRWPIGFGWGPTLTLRAGRAWVLSLGLVEIGLTVLRDDLLRQWHSEFGR